ncbi:MAG: hypothetical protein K2N87_12585 [Eubacterium sp.]|nr:hypothetical protein [Eubacterium sp.]
MKILRSLEEIRNTSGTAPTKKEIAVSFKGMGLTKQQQEFIYEYLQRPQEETVGIQEASLSGETGSRPVIVNEAFFKKYTENLNKIPRLAPKEEELLYERLISGDKEAVQSLSEQWAYKVAELARAQIMAVGEKEAADLIQEGNIGVFLALQQMLGLGKKVDFGKELARAAEEAMERYVQKTMADADMDQSLLVKAALVYEAQKFLAEQLQRLPSATELSQYTRLPETELDNILAILDEKK